MPGPPVAKLGPPVAGPGPPVARPGQPVAMPGHSDMMMCQGGLRQMATITLAKWLQMLQANIFVYVYSYIARNCGGTVASVYASQTLR